MLHEGFPVWDNPDSPDKPRFIFLNEIGIQFGKEGKLNFSEEKFQKAIERDFNGVAEGITGEYGFASQLKSVIQNYNQPGSGMLSVREQTMRNRIRRIDDEIAGKEKRLEQRAQAVTAQFSRLQSSLASLQQQQAYLQSSMGGGGGNNLVQQLLGG
jgi:flagellar hook-associated protein 2